MEFKLNSLQEIDWDEVFPAEDTIIWKNEKWLFSDYTGHFSGAGGQVLETENEPKRYYDSQNNLELKFFVFDDSFLGNDSKGEIEFLLPANWSDDQKNEWFEQYKIDRLAQEDVRREMLSLK